MANTFKTSAAYGPQETPEPVENDAPQAITNWGEFVKARLIPAEIVCQEYGPVHTSVTACHTRLLTKRAKPGAAIDPKTKRPTKTGSAHSLLDHTSAGHGGGFQIKFRQHEAGGESWAGWEELKKSGVEVVDIRCAWCQRPEDRVHAGSLLAHLRPHKGNGRGMRGSSEFLVTLSYPRTAAEDMDEEY